MTTLAFAPSTRSSAPTVTQLHDALWRVTRADGDVLGYVESFPSAQGERFRAKRFLSTQRRFIEVGEFWRMSDATDCFRF